MKEIFVTSANRKRRWKIFVGSDQVLTAEELFFDKDDGEWKPTTSYKERKVEPDRR